MNKPIPLSQPFLSDLEVSYVADAVRSGWLTQSGSYVSQMEREISKTFYTEETSREVTTTSNGTTALHLALLSLEIGSGDEVILPNFGYIAPVNAVLMCNATPVIVDINPSDWCIDTDLVINAITDRTRAIIVIDNYGVFGPIENLRNRIPQDICIIEDAAESFPTNTYNQKNSFKGDLVTTSFYANKVLTSAEGGAICGPSDLIFRINSLKNQSVKSKGLFEHTAIGFNYRISNLHAALFIAQWERLPEILNQRNSVFEKYFEYFKKLDINFTSNQFPNFVNPWLMTIRLPGQSDNIPILREKLLERGIETRPGFKIFSEHEYLKKQIRIGSHLDISKTIAKEVISLPTFPELGEESIAYICETLSELLK